MHVTAIEAAERRNLLSSTRVTATNAARDFGRGRLQHSMRSAWLRPLALVCGLLSLEVIACTPVGEVKKQGAQEREGGAGEPSSPSQAAAVSGPGAPPRQSGGGGNKALVSNGGRTGGAGRGSQSSGQSSAGRAADGGNKAEAGRGGANANSGANAGAGAAGSSHETGTGGMPATAGMSPSTGAAGKAGSSMPRGGAGSAAAGSAANSGWLCTPVGPSCTCVESAQVSSDDCPNPKPTCCFTLVRFGSNACTCWPEDSEECKTQTTEVPDAKPTDHCPP